MSASSLRSFKKLIIYLPILLLVSIFIASILILFNERTSAANHWFLFGTVWDRIVQHYYLCAVGVAGLLVIPMGLERRKLTLFFGILFIPAFIYFTILFQILAD